MKVSLNWLKNYVALPESVTPEQLAHDLTMCTVEVEAVERVSESFELMVVGQVKEILPHPNADKLKLVKTDIGQEKPASIVCGGTNLREGMLVAVALPGAKVRWHGEGDLIELSEAKIRGEKSFGMICSSPEIGLADLFPSSEMTEIIDLSGEPELAELTPGVPLADALGLNDIVLDIDNKSLTNRPDLWGHYGLAREFAAIYNVELASATVPVELPAEDQSELSVSIEDAEHCFRYIGVVIENTVHEKAPFWMRSKLFLMDQRPISLLVDLTNYVLFTLGQPIHIFDYEKLQGQEIIVRKAKEKENILLLDGKDYELSADNLVIADSEVPVALAGVMGGELSGVTESTTKVVLEAATFEATSVRRTAGQFGLRSESSLRFEKAIDTDRSRLAVDLFVNTLKDTQSNIALTAASDCYPKPPSLRTVTVSKDFIDSRIGVELGVEEITEKLERLSFGVKEKGGTFELEVPAWRATGDVSIPEDIVEEVARLYGYDNIEFIPPEVKLEEAVLQPEKTLDRRVKEYLAFSAGMNEVVTYPWVDEVLLEAAGFSTDDCLSLVAPPAPETSCLRPSLIPNMLFAVKQNRRHFESFAVFETALVFSSSETIANDHLKEEKLPKQWRSIAGAVAGANEREVFFKAKGIVAGLFESLEIKMPVMKEASTGSPWAAQGSELEVLNPSSRKRIGSVAVLSGGAALKADIKHCSVALFELDFSAIQELEREIWQYQAIPQYPVVDYELALLVSKDIRWESIRKTVSETHQFITSVSFLDEYSGKQVPEGKKSLSFKFSLSNPEATLSSEEVSQIADKVLGVLGKEFDAGLRAG